MSSRYNDNRDGSGFGGGNRKGPRWMRLFGIILSIVLAVVVVGGALILNYGSHLISLTNYVSDQEVKVVEREEELPSEAVETVSTEEIRPPYWAGIELLYSCTSSTISGLKAEKMPNRCVGL